MLLFPVALLNVLLLSRVVKPSEVVLDAMLAPSVDVKIVLLFAQLPRTVVLLVFVMRLKAVMCKA